MTSVVREINLKEVCTTAGQFLQLIGIIISSTFRDRNKNFG